MRKIIVLLCLTVILLVGAAHLYRDARVQQLFRSAPKVARVVKHKPSMPDRSAALESTGSRGEAETRLTMPRAATATAAEPEEIPRNVTPNDTVSRVLLQVLAARGLSSGISLEVSDRAIRVIGEVESAEMRRTVLAVIDKGREARQVDGSRLVVRN